MASDTTRGGTPRRLAAVSGVASAVGTPTLIVVATLVAPWFSWRTNAFSDLGVTPPTELLFNGTLIVGGLLALPFAWLLWTTSDGLGGRLRGGLFAITAVALGAVGVFPSGDPLHFPVAATHFLGVTVTLAVDGALRRGRTTGRLAGVAAVGHAVAWIAWGQGILFPPGLALPEFVGALVLATWVTALSPVTPLRSGSGFRRGDAVES